MNTFFKQTFLDNFYFFQKSNIIKILLLIIIPLFLSVSKSYGADRCSGSTSNDFDITNPYSDSDNDLDRDQYIDYYFKVPTAGTLTFDDLDPDNDIFYGYDIDGCTFGVGVSDGGSITFTDDLDLNFYVYSTKRNQEFSFSLQFTPAPQVAPIMGDVANTIATINTSFSLDISSYVTLTNGDPILEYTLTGTLPVGLSFNSATGVISGTATEITPASTLSVTATDIDGVSNSDSFTITVQELDIVSTGGRDFALRHQENLFGDVRVIGNTVLCQQSNGVCTESAYLISNDYVNLQKAPESSSLLTIPTGAVIKYARLYWLGRINGSWDSATQASAGKIKLKKDSGTYTELTANIKDAIAYTSTIQLYSASADASSIVNGPGTYYIDTSSFYTVTGTTSNGLGTSGSWALVVVYSDPNETTARNLTIFDGYKGVIRNTDAQASVRGFLTPKSGLVDSTLYVMAAEGDKYLSGTSDQIQMAGATYNTTLQNLGTFDSRIDVDANRTPELINNNGTDIHKYNVGTGNGGAGIIDTNEVGANFNFTSNADVYYPSLFVFSTELYLPQMCYDYSVKQDGQFFLLNRAAYPEARIDEKISSSNLDISIYLRNLEADIPAEGIAIRTDVNSTQFSHVGNIYTSNVNGSALLDRGTPSSSATLCDYDKDGNNDVSNSGCTDGTNIRKGNGSLDAGNYVYTKFTLQPQNISGLADINESLGLSVKYYITADGNKIEYPDYVLGSINVPLCPPTIGYQPEWGYFNVVQEAPSSSNIVNNIYTQVSRKPFNAAVVFDSTPLTGNNAVATSDVNTTVLVEMIDIDSFGDINASCGNPDARVSEPIVVPVNFNSSSYQSIIPIQTNDYYNFAVKNATFRIWHFTDANDTLIENWTATTTNNSKTVTSISGLYRSSVHTQCTSSCSSSSSAACYECIKLNYAKPICARDNFSVRPESYSVHIFDINHSLPAYNIDTNPENLKNTSKIDISMLTDYAPTTTLPTTRMNLAAGYLYRFDINATGNDDTNQTPGYTRAFNGGSDYNAQMLWNPQTAKTNCNDISNHDYSFYVKNGKLANEERLAENIGEYRLVITDTTWTAVDWRDISHHTTSNGFDTSIQDCLNGSSTSSGVQNGCLITTNHGSDSSGNIYMDHNLSFHPYEFDVSSIVPTFGLTHAAAGATSFIYMADINQSQDENMSYHLNGNIVAIGEDNSTLSNFVDGCYAQPLNLDLNRSIMNTPVAYRYRFHSYEANTTEIGTSVAIDLNNSVVPLPLATTIFPKDRNGSANTILNLNYDRDVDTAVNPQVVNFISYDVNCTIANNCTFFADLISNKTTQGTRALDNNVTHYYGRTNAPRQSYTTSSGTAFIYYEAYCSTDATGVCNKALLPGGVDSNSTDDPRWFINNTHTAGQSGGVDTVSQKGGTYVSASALTEAAGEATTTLTYTGTTLPYKTTMENNASSWLIYNKYNNNALTNEFQVEFLGGASSWAGVHETNTSTDNNATTKTNRRSMW
jgi:hypothetical protein